MSRSNGLPSVWYMNFKNLEEPPKFCYSVVNVIEKKLLDEYQKQEEGLQHVKKLKTYFSKMNKCIYIVISTRFCKKEKLQ
ncbi:hypothetical protein B9Z55_007837 [Caenorhabditis nigoni]|uniref:Uncharacterized protein n=1 Tax=Caenorhabditis nigoni TaxID=1611254 RepID=A0A2G5VBK4_9PELO|nr:hypothetical protein B9Z55_007837 [Caenorhabditis nigoni]